MVATFDEALAAGAEKGVPASRQQGRLTESALSQDLPLLTEPMALVGPSVVDRREYPAFRRLQPL